MSTLHNIGFRIAYALAAGLVIGLLDLWVYELSWRGFFAGLVASVLALAHFASQGLFSRA